MPGPHSPNPGVGTNGPAPYPEPSSHEPQALDYPHDLGAAEPAFAPGPADDAALPPAAYPGVPPQVSYPKRRHKRLLIGIVVALALVSAMTAAIIYGVRTNGANTAGTFSEGPAKTAIQGYLNALENRDVDTIVRNALCGIHDGVRDKRSDQALAKLSSDAFRKQFSQVEVTSIDLDRQNRVLVAISGPGAVHHAGDTCRRRPATRSGARHRSVAFPARSGLGVLVRVAHRGVVLAFYQLNESPHAQEPVALGLSMVKPCFSIVSTKSIDAPSTYGALIRSTINLTPPNSAVWSPSSVRSSKKRL